MGKKRASRLNKPQSCEMDGKLESLKSLNAMLMKETFERRQEVDSLQSQLTQLMELIHNERDEMKGKTKSVELKLVETDNKLVDIQNEVLKLNVQKKVLVDENAEKDRKIEAMARDKTSMEKCLAESNWAVDRMKKEIEEIVKDREALEADRNVELKNRNELEKKVSALNEFGMNMQKVETKLRENVAVLEKRFVESVELQKQKDMEINMLVQEKRERENNFTRLMEEKGMLMRNFHEATEQLDEHKKMLKEMSQNKYVIEQDISLLKIELSKTRKDHDHNKKRFWVFISSSAAILAAAIAYAW